MMGLCWTAARELHREALKSDLSYVRTAVACALAMGILVLLDPHGFAEELRSVRREAP